MSDILTDFRAVWLQRDLLRSMMQERGLDLAFRERLMLVVTSVNGCRYCSYAHAREALAEQEEIDALGEGMFASSPREEVPALLYVQHWAETDGKPEPAVQERIRQRYGEEAFEQIEVTLRMIRVGNLLGKTFDYLLHRASFGR